MIIGGHQIIFFLSGKADRRDETLPVDLEALGKIAIVVTFCRGLPISEHLDQVDASWRPHRLGKLEMMPVICLVMLQTVAHGVEVTPVNRSRMSASSAWA
jgi:hypothetical protein